MRSMLPPQVTDSNIYLKLFKNIPRTDIEMVFPNTAVRFRMFDKIKLGVSASGGLGMGVVGAAGKIALLASNPLAAAGAVFGLGGIAGAPSRGVHEPEAALHGGDGKEPLFPLHGGQPRRDAENSRARRRGRCEGGDAALFRAGQGASEAE